MTSRRPFGFISALSLAAFAAAQSVGAQSMGSIVANASANANSRIAGDEFTRYSANQLDNLLGPIALYPDALLAQVLVAATFPDQVDDAARYVRANGTNGIDDQAWDVSVKAVAHYASALNTMADKLDWTATLGRAYANQSSDVMASVQRLRTQAAAHGNLQSTAEQQVVQESGNYVIVPTQSRVIYVPVYDPYIIYSQPAFNVGVRSRYWSFGIGFPIGSWLNYDCDWGLRTVYYNGWNDRYIAYGGGWRVRSRPFVQITNVYVNPNYRTVYVNRDVGTRVIDYRNVDRYPRVHQDTWFDRNGRENRNGDTRNDGRRDGDNRSTARGNDNRGGDNRGGDNRGGDNGSNGGNTGRTGQSRDDRPAATPDGYRNGGSRAARPEVVSAPERRRTEPQVRNRDMNIAPDVVRSRPQQQQQRQAQQQQSQQQQSQQQQSAPKQEQTRQATPQRDGGERRSAQPRPEKSKDDGGKGQQGGDRGRDRRGL